MNQPVSLFPSDLLPSLSITSPHSAAPTTAVTSLKQLRAECSTSANTNFSPESSARQQEQVTREKLKDCVKTKRLAREEAQPVDSDSEEEMVGNIRKEPAAEKPISTYIPERHQNASAAAPGNDGGNESDDSVKMIEPSNPVIHIVESDNEEPVLNVPVHQEPRQMSVSAETSSSSTQTIQQKEAEK